MNVTQGIGLTVGETVRAISVIVSLRQEGEGGEKGRKKEREREGVLIRLRTVACFPNDDAMCRGVNYARLSVKPTRPRPIKRTELNVPRLSNN